MKLRQISILLIVSAFIACSSHEELPPPDNPFDPGNPNYVSPEATLVNGPVEGEVVGTTSITITWVGNESATEYRFRFDESDWSIWGESTEQTLDYLDEGEHSFELEARSINGDIQEIPTLLDFEIDAVPGPSVIAYPYLHTAGPGDTLQYEIIAEEASELFAVECQIEFDSDILELIDVLPGSLQNEWGGTILSVQEVHNSSIDLSTVSVEGSNTSFSGTASILVLKLRIKSDVESTFGNSVIGITTIELVDPQLKTINIQSIRPGVLNVL